MAAPHFIVHDTTDSVGVVVVEGIKRGQTLTGWIMATDETVKLACLDAIPIGHKIAMKPMNKGDTVIKYGHDIGKVVRPIRRGGHVHVHNMKTKRW